MSYDQIARRWRKHLVEKLQDHYGLQPQEAVMKADTWLQWIGQQPIQGPTPNAFHDVNQTDSRKSRAAASTNSNSPAF